MPMGVIGLIIAAIFAAAMSSIAAELNALATASTIDFYKRHFKPDGTDKEYVFFGRIATFVLGDFRLHCRNLCNESRLFDRSRQQIRLVFLRFLAWSFRFGNCR